MEIVEQRELEVVLAPGEMDSLSLEATSSASYYLMTIGAETIGKFPITYEHRFVGDVPDGSKEFDGRGQARSIAYTMPAAEQVTFQFQNISNAQEHSIRSEPEEGKYRVQLVALAD